MNTTETKDVQSTTPAETHEHTHDHAHEMADYGSPPLLPHDARSPVAWLALLIIALYRKAIGPSVIA